MICTATKRTVLHTQCPNQGLSLRWGMSVVAGRAYLFSGSEWLDQARGRWGGGG